MAKHGTASVSPGLFGEFAGAVVSQLWSIVQQMDPGIIDKLARNRDALKQTISEAFVPYHQRPEGTCTITTYKLKADYDQPLEAAFAAGNYEHIGPNFAGHDFSTEHKGAVTLYGALIDFNRDIKSMDDAVHEINQLNFRPAELRELLAFGAQFPHLQRLFSIAAVGSQFRIYDTSQLYAPVLYVYGKDRSVQPDSQWYKGTRFLAIRKES